MRVQFAGRIATEPTTRTVEMENEKDNFQVTEFSIAELTKKDDPAQFHTVVYTGNQGVVEYLKKGGAIQVNGKMVYDVSKEDENGKSHKYYKIKTTQIDLISSAADSE